MNRLSRLNMVENEFLGQLSIIISRANKNYPSFLLI